MDRAAIQIEGGKLLVNASPLGVILTVHTGAGSYSLRMSRQAAAQMGDAVAALLTSAQPMADKVDAAIASRTFRERIEGVAR